jgi:hypothetical protein
VSRCVDSPVSWLRLEQLALGEADAGARAHVDGCHACRGALATIESDRRQLRPLRLEVIRPRRSWLRWTGGGALVAAAAAIALFAVIDRGGDDLAGSRVAIKGGGELVISLVRERGGQTDEDPSSFVDGDRFKVAVTCTEPAQVTLEISVTQSGERFFPLGRRSEIACSNRALVPGAFSVTGRAPITVCVRPDPGSQSACVELGAGR